MNTTALPRLWTGEAVLEHALAVAGVEPPKGRNARRRLAQFDALTGFLDRTDSADGAPTPGVPSRLERDRLLAAARPYLVKLAAKEARAKPRRRRRHITPTRTETPMRTDYKPGHVIEGPREEPAKPATNGHLPGIPEVVAPYLARFELLFRTPSAQPSAVLTHEAYRLAKVLLDCPPRDQEHILARILFRLATRSGR
jgi:hypothetical protein